MLKDIITKILEEDINDEAKAYIEKQKSILNHHVAKLLETLGLNPQFTSLDDAIVRMQEELDFDELEELKPVIESINRTQKASGRAFTELADKRTNVEKAMEILTNQYNQFISIIPASDIEHVVILESIIENYINPTQGFNITLENGIYDGLNLGNKELVLSASLSETQKFIAELNLSEEEFLNSPDAHDIIKGIVRKHRKVGHILAIICINNWKVDFNSIVTKNSDISPQLAFDTINSYDMTKAKYEYLDFNTKINTAKLFIEGLDIPSEEKKRYFERIRRSIEAKELEYQSDFYQSKIGDNLTLGINKI